jgi:hypothetical protein
MADLIDQKPHHAARLFIGWAMWRVHSGCFDQRIAPKVARVFPPPRQHPIIVEV